MSRSGFDLKAILDIPRWEKMQDELARATGTAIITIDYKGTPVTKHSMRTEFCSVIRENPISCKRCHKCDSLAGLEATRLNRPFIYLCHCGIVDVAVPIIVGNQYLGAMMFGQVRLAHGSDAKVERLVNEISSFSGESEQAATDLKELYHRLPEMEYERIKNIADTLNAIVQYIVDKAVENRAEKLSYEWKLRSLPGSMQDLPVEIAELYLPEENDSTEEHLVLKNSPVYPAVLYVDAHLNELISMQEMAELCHLSRSYFSRLFRQEVGENFVDYVNRRKVSRAKELLRTSAKSVGAIAGELGFVDTSYFVKLFKRFEGITPLSYRKLKS